MTPVGQALIIRSLPMKETLKYLLKIQGIIMIVLILCVLLSPWHAAVTAVLSGGMLCLLTTVQAMLIFYRLPDVLLTQRFLHAVKQAEIRKWLIVAILGTILVQRWQPLGVLTGFAIPYTAAYFWAILKK